MLDIQPDRFFLSTAPRFLKVALFFALAPIVFGQSENSSIRDATILTFPPKQDVEVLMAGNKRFPKLNGLLKVERTEREGTKVEIKINNLPAVLDLGGLYTTYIAWIIEPSGKATSIAIIDSKAQGSGDQEAKATTPSQAFAVVITAEPHTQMRVPSRFVMLESDYSSSKAKYSVTTSSVAYTVNNSDYFSNEQVVGSGEKAYRKIPLPVLRAERALSLARYANAELYAPDKYKNAREKFTSLNDRIKQKVSSSEIELRALEVEVLAAKAEEEAEKLRQLRRETQLQSRREDEKKETEGSLTFYKNRTEELTSQIKREEGRRLSTEQRLNESERKLDDAEKDNAQYKLEVADLKKRLSEQTEEKNALSRRLEILADFSLYRGYFAEFGKVREERGSLIVTLPVGIWVNRTASLSEPSFDKLIPMFSKLAEKSDFDIVVITEIEDSGDEAVMKLFAEDRARVLATRISDMGIQKSRISENASVRVSSISKKKSAFKELTEIEIRLPIRSSSK